MAFSLAVRDAPVPKEPSPLAPYTQTTDKATYPFDDEDPTPFTIGKWEVQLTDWHWHCVPNGWMACCLPCVSVAQISVRMGTDSYGAALAKQLAFNVLVWGILAVELVFCIRYAWSLESDRFDAPWVSLTVVLVACLVVVALSLVWANSLVKLRARVRERFQIHESPADDKYAMRWCTPCAIAQMATQVKSYTPGSCDFRAPDALPAYIP